MHHASVIIPTYNRAHILRETLTSVYSQHDVDLDVILIDDESTDDTPDVAGEFPGLTYVQQARSGPNVGRNRAMAMAKYDYIAMLDDDDLWEPYKLALQLEILEREPEAAYIFSDFWIMKPDGIHHPHGLSTWKIPPAKLRRLHENPVQHKSPVLSAIPGLTDSYILYHKVHIYSELLEDPMVLPSTAIFRKSMIPKDAKFVDDDYICGDWEFFARLSREHTAIFLPLETTVNRSHEDATRLTRTSDRVQLAKRQRMVASVWESDPDYMHDHAERVHDVQAKYHAAQAKLALRDGDYDDVRQHIEQAYALGHKGDTVLLTLNILSHLPFGLKSVRALDALRHHH